MSCCNVPVFIYEFKNASGANVPLAASVTDVNEGTYSNTTAEDLPSVNNAFFVDKNEFGEDTLYMLGFASCKPYVGSYIGTTTAHTEYLFIKLFGPHRPSK